MRENMVVQVGFRGFGNSGEKVVTGCDGFVVISLDLPSTTCWWDKPTLKISLITILKTFVKRFILIMSRHRFVRNLDLDRQYFLTSCPPLVSFSHHSAEERDDGALSDGGDDMTPEQHGMGIFFPIVFVILFAEIGR